MIRPECPPCNDGDHATVEDGFCTCCGDSIAMTITFDAAGQPTITP